MGKYVSIISGATELPEQSVAHLTHDLIYQSGILDPAADQWKVIQNNPTGMSVLVHDGRGYFKKSTMTYHGYSNTEAQTTDKEVVTIAANNSGNPRKSVIIAYLDLTLVAENDGAGILLFAEVEGTPGASPVAPTDSEITTEIGAGNPFIRLAEVAVANGASSITSANIMDVRKRVKFNPQLVSPDGWAEAEDEWVYASATSFTIADVDRTEVFQKGTKIRLKQGGSYKYFYVTSSSFSTNTTVNITGGDDYSLDNASITDNYISYQENPAAFPASFAFTPALAGTSGSVGAYTQDNTEGSRFTIKGKTLVYSIVVRITNKGSWSGDVRLAYPVAPINLSVNNSMHNTFLSANGVNQYTSRGRGTHATLGDTHMSFMVGPGAGYTQWSSVVANDWVIGNGFYDI